jgi:hypothetical protein
MKKPLPRRPHVAINTRPNEARQPRAFFRLQKNQRDQLFTNNRILFTLFIYQYALTQHLKMVSLPQANATLADARSSSRESITSTHSMSEQWDVGLHQTRGSTEQGNINGMRHTP